MYTRHKLFTQKWFSIIAWCLLLPLLTSQTSLSLRSHIPSLTLTQRQICDLELIVNGGFAPLDSFMNKRDYEAVVDEMRLADGTIWPIPIVLDIQEKNLEIFKEASQIALRDQEGFLLAYLKIEEFWKPNKWVEAEKVYGTTDTDHPGVNYLLNQTGVYYVTGKLMTPKCPIITILFHCVKRLKN